MARAAKINLTISDFQRTQHTFLFKVPCCCRHFTFQNLPLVCTFKVSQNLVCKHYLTMNWNETFQYEIMSKVFSTQVKVSHKLDRHLARLIKRRQLEAGNQILMAYTLKCLECKLPSKILLYSPPCGLVYNMDEIQLQG